MHKNEILYNFFNSQNIKYNNMVVINSYLLYIYIYIYFGEDYYYDCLGIWNYIFYYYALIMIVFIYRIIYSNIYRNQDFNGEFKYKIEFKFN